MAIDFNITRRSALQRFVGAGAILSIGMSTTSSAHNTPSAEYFLEQLESMFSETWARITDAGGTYQRYQDAISLAEVIAIAPAQTFAGIALKARIAAISKTLGNGVVKLPLETQRRLEIRAEAERKALEARHAR
ncbi:hypothetical protein [Brucella anthropi]|uniref:hypothetical protein n=1 Tax=Brucella anthropi TaxID=529 RepID=UPI00124C0A76|nr:hypothetical protein [Brucella anthropi]KAB2779415.1 hypothetical protein F9K99_13935 [Brucella anthropi]